MIERSKKLTKQFEHELLDRSYICAEMIDFTLLTHPVLDEKKYIKFKKKVLKAHNLLIDAYIEIGGKI